MRAMACAAAALMLGFTAACFASRAAADRNADRLGAATRDSWDELRRRVSESLDSADQRIRALRPDAKPMGGTGGPG